MDLFTDILDFCLVRAEFIHSILLEADLNQHFVNLNRYIFLIENYVYLDCLKVIFDLLMFMVSPFLIFKTEKSLLGPNVFFFNGEIFMKKLVKACGEKFNV